MGSGYKVHSVDGKAGEVSLAHVRTFSKEYRVAAGTAGTYMVTKVPAACTAIAVRTYRTGGTGGTVNAKKNSSDLLASVLTTTTDSWAASTTLQNASFAAGDTLSVVTASPAGTPTDVIVQVDFRIDVPA
jgi:hypothetical protein